MRDSFDFSMFSIPILHRLFNPISLYESGGVVNTKK